MGEVMDNPQEHEVATVLRRLVRSLDLNSSAHDFGCAMQEARELLNELDLPAVHKVDDDAISRAEAQGIRPFFEQQEHHYYGRILRWFTLPLKEGQAQSIASHFKMDVADRRDDALWILSDDDDDKYITIYEGREGTLMDFGPGRLTEVMEFLTSIAKS